MPEMKIEDLINFETYPIRDLDTDDWDEIQDSGLKAIALEIRDKYDKKGNFVIFTEAQNLKSDFLLKNSLIFRHCHPPQLSDRCCRVPSCCRDRDQP